MKKAFLSKILKSANFGKFNRIEKTYIALFILSIFAGIVYGIFNPDSYKPAEETGQLDLKEGDNNLTIFYRNFLLSGIELVTAGVASLYFNFISFSIASSFFYSKSSIVALIFVMLTFGIMELLGSMLIGLVGINFAERLFGRFVKLKSKLNVRRIFIAGAILLFSASAIEYGLILLLRSV